MPPPPRGASAALRSCLQPARLEPSGRPRRASRRRLAASLAVAALGLVPAPAGAAPWFLRLGLGWERSSGTTVSDLECSRTQPPALFGCGAGNDGLQMAARGDFGDGERWELGLGLELGERTRLELTASRRPSIDLAAEANFRGVAAPQPVRAGGRSQAMMLVAARDLGPLARRVRPFVALGAGVARNESEAVVYSFPTLAPQAVTVLRGGDHRDLAWMVGAGASVRLTPALHLDLDLRYTDLGELRTDAGLARIVRSRGTFELVIDGTRAELATAGVGVALRYRVGGVASHGRFDRRVQP